MRKAFLGAVIAAAVLVMSLPLAAAELVYSGVATTSDDYALGVIWSSLLKPKKVDMTVVENGSVAGMRKAAKGEVDFVGIGSPHYLDAVNGTGAFKSDPAEMRDQYKKMRVILSIPTGMAQYVAKADSGIQGIADFRGKKVGIGRPGGNAGRVSKILFQVHGLPEDAVDGQHLEYGPALEQMASGTLDATLVWGGLPTAAIDNASRSMKLRFVAPDPATLDKFRAAVTNGKYYIFQKIPPASIEKAYGDRVVTGGKPTYFWTFPFQILVRDGVDDETVYKMTKALWESIDKVHGQSAALSLVSIDSALDGLSAELHPGAARYYKEVGKLK